MSGLSDTACSDGSGHYAVLIRNAEGTAQRIWKNVATRIEAEAEAAALRVHKFEVEIQRVGEPQA